MSLQAKYCSRCKRVKAASDFNKRGGSRNGLQSYCIDCTSAYKAAYNQANSQKIKLRQKQYAEAHRDEYRAWYRKWASSKTQRAKIMVLRAKDRAKKKELPFDIVPEDLVLPDRCPILGLDLNYTFKNSGKLSPNSPSLDRRIPKLGYVKGNVQVISARANWIKSDASYEEIAKVAEYLRITS